MGITTTGWPGKRSKNAATCSGVVAFSSDSIGRLWRTGACSTRGRADPLERVRVRRQLGVLGDQRPQLVLERVVVGVGDERLAAVVGLAQLHDARGERLDPLADVLAHGSNATTAAGRACGV